jgi:hypothetical protein
MSVGTGKELLPLMATEDSNVAPRTKQYQLIEQLV